MPHLIHVVVFSFGGRGWQEIDGRETTNLFGFVESQNNQLHILPILHTSRGGWGGGGVVRLEKDRV